MIRSELKYCNFTDLTLYTMGNQMADPDQKQCELPFIPDNMYCPEVFSVFLERYWICIMSLIDKNVTLVVV